MLRIPRAAYKRAARSKATLAKGALVARKREVVLEARETNWLAENDDGSAGSFFMESESREISCLEEGKGALGAGWKGQVGGLDDVAAAPLQ